MGKSSVIPRLERADTICSEIPSFEMSRRSSRPERAASSTNAAAPGGGTAERGETALGFLEEEERERREEEGLGFRWRKEKRVGLAVGREEGKKRRVAAIFSLRSFLRIEREREWQPAGECR